MATTLEMVLHQQKYEIGIGEHDDECESYHEIGREWRTRASVHLQGDIRGAPGRWVDQAVSEGHSVCCSLLRANSDIQRISTIRATGPVS